MLTAYDALMAEWLEQLGVDFILVGDSLGMVVLGYPDTTFVTPQEMLHHIKAVRRGAKNTFLVGDLPLKGVQKGPRQALATARQFLEEGGCDAVKVEWLGNSTLKTLELFNKYRIPFMGHTGLAPQALKKNEKYKVRGKKAEDALQLLNIAKIFQDKKAFSVLLECVPSLVSEQITKNLTIPTIGIGAGPNCDGQVLVSHDVVGLFDKFSPKFVKHYAESHRLIKKALQRFIADVRRGNFPTKSHAFSIEKSEFDKFKRFLIH